jgi:chorismate-pyruvate lyase
VTDTLERLVGEPIDAEPEGHRGVRAEPASRLEVPGGHPLLCRAACLQGRRSGRPYLIAVTLLVPSRLPAAFVPQLESGHRPIGRILTDQGMEVTRERLAGPDPVAESMWPDAAPVPDEVLLARTYRVRNRGLPIMVISEWFLTTLRPYVTPDDPPSPP